MVRQAGFEPAAYGFVVQINGNNYSVLYVFVLKSDYSALNRAPPLHPKYVDMNCRQGVI